MNNCALSVVIGDTGIALLMLILNGGHRVIVGLVCGVGCKMTALLFLRILHIQQSEFDGTGKILN